MSWRPVLLRTALGGLAIFLALQLVPYGWRHPNPPVTDPTTWPSAQAEALARGACYDCHSNETRWPAYSYVAPMSWLVRRDVEAGRDELNFSTWSDASGELDDAIETIEEGSMPPRQYELLHPDARLSEAEKAALIAALAQLEEADRDRD